VKATTGGSVEVAGAMVVVVGGMVVVVEGGVDVVVAVVDVVEVVRGVALLDVDEPHAPAVTSITTANAATRKRGGTSS
jgi:hypothetical protein